MPRRAVLLIALLCLAGLAGAVAPWTVSSGLMSAAVGTQLREGYGVDLTVHGRRTIAFLPVPRLKFEDVSLRALDGTPLVDGGELRGEFRVVPLLMGRLELTDLWLNRARVTVGLGERGALAAVLARLDERARGRSPRADHLRRLILTETEVVLQDRNERTVLRDVNVIANWSRADGPLDLSGSLAWRGEPISLNLQEFRPAAYLAGQPTPFSARVSTGAGALRLDGEALPGELPGARGQMEFQVRSVRDLARWAGLPLPLAPLMDALSGEGSFILRQGVVSWPSIALSLGQDRLDGALTASLKGGRPAVSGTLAAERLDLTGFFAPFAQARASTGGWTAEPISLDEATGADLDVRLSSTAARIGPMRLEDVAASVLVTPGRVEASLGRAGLNRGVVKGRLTLAAAGPRTDVRLVTSFERVDVGAFLADLGRNRWIGGTGQGQIQLEGVGESPAEVMRDLHGRAGVTVRGGELIGMGVAEALKRVERRPLSASFDWKGGRTPFDQATLHLNVAAGVGEVAEGGFASPANRGLVQGRISFAERWLGLKYQVDAAAPAASPGQSPTLVFDVNGSWDDVSVVPDVRALIQRSGAAQPLLGPESNALPSRALGLGAATPR